MAASSSEGGAARAQPPLPPDQLASFYKLVDKKAVAGQLGRHTRNAELSAQAAVQAEALFGGDSLVVADLRYNESESLNNLAMRASGAESEALDRRAWAALLSVIPLLLRRLANDTLLPGTIREEELDYEAHMTAVIKQTLNEPDSPPAELRASASTIG